MEMSSLYLQAVSWSDFLHILREVSLEPKAVACPFLLVGQVTRAAEKAEVKKTALQAYQYCRDICSWRLLNHDSPLQLGGTGVTVQIDESVFRHKLKVGC